jgi:hypothetical protein
MERRSESRPQLGDRRMCARCGSTMRFFERHVVQKGTAYRREPAWVCQCGFEEFVREPYKGAT